MSEHERTDLNPHDIDLPERMRLSWPVLLLILVVILLVAMLFVPLPFQNRLLRSLPDLAHGPMFAFLSFVACAFAAKRWRCRVSRPWQRLGIFTAIGLVIVGLSAISEVAQELVGRHASRRDLAANACGTFAGICWFTATLSGVSVFRAVLYLAGAAAIAGILYSPIRVVGDAAMQILNVPLLSSFESQAEMTRLHALDAGIYRSPRHATDGKYSLGIELQTVQYSGIRTQVHENWERYDLLILDVYLDSPHPLQLVVKIADWSHNGDHFDRFHQVADLRQGSNEIRVDLADVRTAPKSRSMEMDEISFISLFVVRPERPATLFVDNVRLATH